MNIPVGLGFDDVLIIPRFSTLTSRTEPDTKTLLYKDHEIPHPIIPANMDSIATPEMKKVFGQSSFIHHRFMNFDKFEAGDIVTIGMRDWFNDKPKWKQYILELWHIGIACVVIDIAHAHHRETLCALEYIKSNTGLSVIVGNIADGVAADQFCCAGVDGLKVGIGPGHSCTTRLVTGVGVPQLTAIEWASRAAKHHDVPIIADGGIRGSADIAKAIAAGASSVMVGKLLAATTSAHGDVLIPLRNKKTGNEFVQRISYDKMPIISTLYDVIPNKNMMKEYWGQSSEHFQNIYYDGVKEGTVPEGEKILVPYNCEYAQTIIDNLIAGLRQSMTYVGAHSIKSFQEKAKFIRTTHIKEN